LAQQQRPRTDHRRATRADLGARGRRVHGLERLHLQLEPGRRIVQSWRTTKFTATDPDSQIEVLLQPAPGGTKVTVNHTNVPDGHTSYRDGGWQRSYFDPMKEHFKRA
jgi:activator of HSP90 ATPase